MRERCRVGLGGDGHSQAVFNRIRLADRWRMNEQVPGGVASLDMESRLRLEGRVIERKQIVQELHRLDFQQKTLVFLFADAGGRPVTRVPARVHTCAADQLLCGWSDPDRPALEGTVLRYLLIPRRHDVLAVEPRWVDLAEPGIRVGLPDSGFKLNTRKAMRHAVEPIHVRIHQGIRSCTGRLMDFSPLSFRVHLDETADPDLMEGIAGNATLSVAMATAESIIWTGLCQPSGRGAGLENDSVLLAPIHRPFQALQSKKYRSERLRLVPTPQVVFRHPLTGRTVNLIVHDISGMGISVYEDVDRAVLMPAMVLPEMKLIFSDVFSISCRMRVIHRRLSGAHEDRIICGLVFLDMTMTDHTRLLSGLQLAREPRSQVCPRPDMDALWEFFFSTGFIQARQYRIFKQGGHETLRTLASLYVNRPDISRHFVFQDRGRIKGHIAMLHAYARTWMMHHFAAVADAEMGGPHVLNQISLFTNDSYCLESNRMSRVIVYLSPDDPFSTQVFGGAARQIDNSQKCSLDGFAHFHVERPDAPPRQLPPPFALTRASHGDLMALKAAYERRSGGLMLKALDLDPDTFTDDAELNAAYATSGLRRERHLFCLKHGDTPKAVITILLTAPGINLSSLTHCIHVFFVDSGDVPKEVLMAALKALSRKFPEKEAAVLLFPSCCAESFGIEPENGCTLWAMEMRFSDEYYDYLKNCHDFSGIEGQGRACRGGL